MLPPELCALLLLATSAIASPQTELPPTADVSYISHITDQPTTVEPNISITPPGDPTSDPTNGPTGEPSGNPEDDPGNDIQDPGESDWDHWCGEQSCVPVNIVPELPTASGWDDNNLNQPSDLVPPRQTPSVIVTRRPTIITIVTNTERPRETRPPGNDDQQNTPGSNNDQQNKPGGGSNANGEDRNPQQTRQNNLLENIVSGLGDTPSGRMEAQSAQQAPVTQAPTPAATATVGGIITAGDVPLTLTPGLSTTIGAGPEATFIGITTNDAGQTVITISSSGTAVTATVTDAPLTVTLPKTGWDASITDASSPGQYSSTAPARPASTSRSGGAVGQKASQSWLAGALMGVLGAVAVL